MQQKLLTIFTSIALTISLLSLPMNSASAASVKMKVVNTSTLYVYKTTNTKTIIKKIKRGTQVTRLSTKNGWSNISVAGKRGWVKSKYLSRVSNIGKYYSVTTASLNVRNNYKASSKKIGSVKFGGQYKILKQHQTTKWLFIEYKKGKRGWVSSQYGNITTAKKNGFPKGTIFGPLSGRTIIIDAGHGGSDPGAQYFGKKEKTLNLKAAKVLQKELKADGAKVVMTRTGDTFPTLQKRVKISKSVKPDAYLSIHHNANKPGEHKKGFLALYSKKSDKMLTKYIYNAGASAVKKQTKVKPQAYRYQSLHVLRENPHIGTLIEYGYMDNEDELNHVDTERYRQIMATAIAKGLDNYFDKY